MKYQSCDGDIFIEFFNDVYSLLGTMWDNLWNNSTSIKHVYFASHES